jgi:hypothetical protein
MDEAIDGSCAFFLPLPAGYVVSEKMTDVSLVLGIVDAEGFEAAYRIESVSVRVDQVALQPPYHDPGALGLAWQDVSREPLVVQEFE